MRLLVEFHSYHHLLEAKSCSHLLVEFPSRQTSSTSGLEPITIVPVMGQEFPTTLFRQALNHLKLLGD